MKNDRLSLIISGAAILMGGGALIAVISTGENLCATHGNEIAVGLIAAYVTLIVGFQIYSKVDYMGQITELEQRIEEALHKTDMLHHLEVVGGFLFQLHGVGAGGRGHAPEAQFPWFGDGGAVAYAQMELVVGAHCGDWNAVILGEDGETFLSGTNDIVAAGNSCQQRRDIGLLDNLEIFV